MATKDKMRQCPEYYEAKGLSHNDAVIEAKKYARSRCRQNIEYYERMYPEKTPEEHKQMMEEYKKSYLAKRPNNSGINNPAHHSKTTPEERKRRSPMCIEFYEYKYPEKTHEEHLQMLSDHKKLVKNRITPENTCTRIEYWLAKGYSEEEARKILSTKFIWNLERSIAKYGLEEGTKRFNKRNENWQKSLHKSFLNPCLHTQSRWAQNVIDNLKPYFKEIEQEYLLSGFSYDLRLDNKFIEFNGDYWHMNPSQYKSTDVQKISGKTAKQIWDKDKRKIEAAKQNNFNILVIWENDYSKDPIAIIQQCKKFLES